MKPCAIVILNYNGKKVLRQCLPSVVTHSSSDVWVIDNCSTDQSVSLINKNFPSIQVVELKENLGFAGGYNLGLQQLQGLYEQYILLNSDVEVTPSWDEDLTKHLEENPKLAALQPKILSWSERDHFDYAGAGGGFLDQYGYPYCRGRIWNTIEEDKGQYDDAIPIDWASGACFVIRAEVFHDMEGFDPQFFAHMEEIDLCWRMKSQGWQIGYLGTVKVYHMGGATLTRTSPKKLYLNIRNSLTMIFKNTSKNAFRKIFLFKSILEFLAALAYLIQGKAELSKAIYRGYRDFLSGRNTVKKTSLKKSFLSEGPAKNIFWLYFVKRKKTYSEI